MPQEQVEIGRPSEGLRGFEPEIQERPDGNCCCPSPNEQDDLYRRLDEFIDELSDQDGILIKVLHTPRICSVTCPVKFRFTSPTAWANPWQKYSSKFGY